MTIQWDIPDNLYNIDFSAALVSASMNNPFYNQSLFTLPLNAPTLSMPTMIHPSALNSGSNVFSFQPQQSSSQNQNNSSYKPLGGFVGNLTSIARSYIGYKESDGSYLKFTGGRQEAWCADFVSYCARQAGNTSLNTSSVEGIRQWGIQNGKYKQNPQVGDAIILKNGMSHTGIVESISGNSVTCIEGNSSDQVKRVTYSLSDSRISGFVTLA